MNFSITDTNSSFAGVYKRPSPRFCLRQKTRGAGLILFHSPVAQQLQFPSFCEGLEAAVVFLLDVVGETAGGQ